MKLIPLSELTKTRFFIDNSYSIFAERPSGYTFQTKNRPLNGFIYIYEGSIRITYNGEDFEKNLFDIVEGNLVYIPQGYKYKTEYTGQITKSIVFNFKIVDETDDCILSQDIIKFKNARQYANLWDRIIECSNMVNDAKYIYAKELLYSLLYKLIVDEAISLQNPKYEKILPAVWKIEYGFKEPILISQLAKLAHLSESCFRRLFREFTGMSPIEYRNNIRIKRARELLQSGSYTVREAAEEIGFNNISYFCRLYYKLTGKHASDKL